MKHRCHIYWPLQRTDWASRDISPPNDLYVGAYDIFVPIPIEIKSYLFWVCARHNNHKYKINVTEICYFILLRRLTYFVLLRGSFQDSGACKRPYSIRKFIMFFSAFLFKSTQMKRRNCSTLFSFSIIAYFSRACLVYNEGKEWEFSIYGQKSLKFDPSLRALCPILFTFGNVTLTRGFCDAGYLHKI